MEEMEVLTACSKDQEVKTAGSKKSHLTYKEKKIIFNVFNALEKDYPMKLRLSLIDKCSEYTGFSRSSVYRILREQKTKGEVQRPEKGPGRKKLILDDFQRNAIRRIVHRFFYDNKIPTLNKVLESVNEDNDIPRMGKTSLRKILHDMNFVFAKADRNSFLMERDEIIVWRRNYIETIRAARQQGRKCFYLDETWLNQGHTVTKVWQDKSIKSARQAHMEGWSTGLKTPTGKGKRLIITHIGSESGFVEDGLLSFVSRKTSDYHEDMNGEVFEEWFSKILLKIEPGSVVVMDNAPYHSRLMEKLPTTAWRKAEIQEWLNGKGIPYNPTAIRPELLTLAKQHSPTHKKYIVDEMAKGKGIEILRLPPYHCELNPIELIWAEVKGKVARENRTFKLEEVKGLLSKALQEITADYWQKCIEHAKKVEDQLWDIDVRIDKICEPIIINLGADSDSDSLSSD